MARKGSPKKRKTTPKVKYKVGDKVSVNVFGVIKEGIVEEIDNLDGTKLYNIISEKTKYPYVGVDGNGNFWNIDSKLTKEKYGKR